MRIPRSREDSIANDTARLLEYFSEEHGVQKNQLAIRVLTMVDRLAHDHVVGVRRLRGSRALRQTYRRERQAQRGYRNSESVEHKVPPVVSAGSILRQAELSGPDKVTETATGSGSAAAMGYPSAFARRPGGSYMHSRPMDFGLGAWFLPALLLFALNAHAQQDDVTFMVIGKHSNVQQGASGTLTPVDYSFFAEIFLTRDGDADSASLEFPTGETVPFRDMRTAMDGSRDNIFLISGEDRFTTFDGLQNRYPDGDYRMAFETPSGDVADTLTFRRRPLPNAPQINVHQGALKQCVHLTPGEDIEVNWQPFRDGRADANGILDDLIFVILTDADGNRVAHSGRPFEGRPHLTFADRSHVIAGDVLLPGARYTLSVEHALLDDTVRLDGVPAFTTRAVTTKLELTTRSSGGSEQSDCSENARTPPIDEHITMLYYDDLDAAADFYGQTLGLEKIFDWDWVKFFRTAPSATVGIVKAGDGAYHEPQPKNAVMVSLVTSDVDAWYDRLEDRDDIRFLKHIGDGGGIRSFLLEDPGGYTVEFFEWLPSED